MNESTFIVTIDAVKIGFRKKNVDLQLLENINLTVKNGELIGLIGRNGSGKSTLLRSIVRLQELLHGTIFFRDKNIRNIHPNEFAQLFAYVSSSFEYTETMTVSELVSLGRFPYTNWIGHLTSSDIELIEEAILKVGIEHLASSKLNEISDGERQKAMIARTLAQNTPLIVLDEPTAFLDLPSKYDIISLLHELTRKGKTVVYSTHDLNIAMHFSDKIWLIDGKTIHDGSPEDLIIDKTIACIFDSDKIHLNGMTGDFELRKHFTKSICLKCEIPNLFYWTRQAIQRSGYEVVEYDKDIPIVTVELVSKDTFDPPGDKIIWKIQRFNENLSFESIYDLLSAL
jgi:iron complex transport system ATP-binding protein